MKRLPDPWLAIRARRMAATLMVVASLAGCGSTMSGLDAKTDFACKAPEGVRCQSMAGVHANAMAAALPGQQTSQLPGQQAGPVGVSSVPSTALSAGTGLLTMPIQSGTPLRSAPQILRVWFAPWEDSDGNLHDQSYVYLPVDSGRWVIEHNHRRIQEAYRPVRAPAEAPGGKPAAKASPAAGNSSSLQRTAQDMLDRLARQQAANKPGGTAVVEPATPAE